MIELSRVSIEPPKIVSFLKKDIQFKEVCQKIWADNIIERAARERGLSVTPEEIQAEADRFRLQNHLEKSSDTLAWLADRMISADDWEKGIRDRLLSKKLSNLLFSKEIEKYFAQNKLEFEQILLYQIIVPYERVAKELFYQIEEQEISFYEAAHLYDIDERRRQQCGYEGKLYRWSLKPDLTAIVFNAAIGDINGPLQTSLGYHLLMVEEFIPAQLTPNHYQTLLDRMFKNWLDSEINYMLNSQKN